MPLPKRSGSAIQYHGSGTLVLSSVADPVPFFFSGVFLIPESRVPNSYFGELVDNFLVKICELAKKIFFTCSKIKIIFYCVIFAATKK
jgi:hypothetical protein